MLRIVSLHIGSDRPQALRSFYRQILDTEPAWEGDTSIGFMVGDFRLEITGHDKVSGKNSLPERMFLDFQVDDVRAEFQRIVALGASVIQPPYEFADGDMKLCIATLADPDGNFFQLVAML